MLGLLLIDLSSGEMATMLALIRNSEGRQSSKGEGRGWNYGGHSAVKSLWDVRGWGGWWLCTSGTQTPPGEGKRDYRMVST